jgi:hypothetical protein
MFEGGFEVFDDLLGENIRSGRLSDLRPLLSRSEKTSRLVFHRLT